MTEVAPFPQFDGTQACAGLDPETFFPHDSASTAYDAPEALRACRRCPFIRECLAYALTHDVKGIWGGTYYLERERMRCEHGLRADRTGLNFSDVAKQADVVQMIRGGGASN